MDRMERACERCGDLAECVSIRGRWFCIRMCREEIRDWITHFQLMTEKLLKERWQ